MYIVNLDFESPQGCLYNMKPGDEVLEVTQKEVITAEVSPRNRGLFKEIEVLPARRPDGREIGHNAVVVIGRVSVTP
jgi:hypothetical protein